MCKTKIDMRSIQLQGNLSTFLAAGVIISVDQKNAWVGYGQSIWSAFEDLKKDQAAFYFPDFFLTKKMPWLQFSHSEYLSLEVIDEVLANSGFSTKLHHEWINPYRSHFDLTFDDLQRIFSRKMLQKAVPYVFSFSNSSITQEQLVLSLRKAISYARFYPCHLYGFWNNAEGVLGVSPEILFNYEKNENVSSIINRYTLSTMALAGTSRKEVCINAFMKNPKERAEHQLTITGIVESLRKLGLVTVGETTVLELPNLNHLLTKIQVDLSHSMQFEEYVKLLHPTPALGAFPSKIGWNWLKEYDKKMERRYFGAPIGVLYPQQNKGKCIVGIRNVQWNNYGMKIGAGCGVIEGSQSEKEWNEIELKLAAIKDMLSL